MTRTKIFRTTAVLFLLLAGFSACRQDDLPGPSAPGGGTATTLAFVSDPMALHRVTTRSSDMKDEEEKRINRLYIFFFDAGGEYLDGDYLTGYPNAPDNGGYYAAGEGVSLLKIDSKLFDDPDLARSATVYAVANVDPGLFGSDDDGDGRPDTIRNRTDLENFVYSLDPGRVALGLPAEGMPMVGHKVLDLTGGAPEDERRVELQALMARIDVSIRLESDVQEDNLPAFYLMDWTARNLPTRAAFTAPDGDGRTGWTERWTKEINTPLQRTIYNKNGQIDFSFYMFENVQNAEWKIDEGENWVDPNVNPEELSDEERAKALYPDSISDSQKQRYKPYLAHADAAAVELHGFYTTYNDATYEVTYTLYLGANHTDDFRVKRNHQYKNDITIKGLTAQSSAAGEYTLDARVNVEENDNEYYIAMLRERNHDAHFCVTPMDVYLFAPAGRHPTMEVILGEVIEGREVPLPGTVPDWIRMERITTADMAAGTVTDSGFTPYGQGGTHLAAGSPWTAGNGKRAFFTKGLLKSGGALSNGTQVTVEGSRDRVYFYLDENLDKNPDGSLKQENRTATVTLIYKENGREVKRRTLRLEQTYLLPVTITETYSAGEVRPRALSSISREKTIYMEQYEEYLDHYDPLDGYATGQIYNGLPWGLWNEEVGDTRGQELLHSVWFVDYYAGLECSHNWYMGLEYTNEIVNSAAQGIATLNDPPRSASEYCYNRNKRNADGAVADEAKKWFLPGIRQMENALTKYYTTFEEFQSNYYWSSAAGERAGGTDGQNTQRARATKINPNGGYVQSGGSGSYDYPRGGYALRTESLRIRAFRNDLEPVD